MKNILIVDDQKEIVDVVKAYLEKEGYNVYEAYSGKKALDIYSNNNLDFIILDLMLPDLSGEEVCRKIRMKSQIPIIMLTAKIKEGERIYGLDIGADDYIVKPFSPKELVARVRAIMRRSDEEFVKANILEFEKENLKIDLNSRKVTKNNNKINLTPTEFDILKLLTLNPGKVFSRDELVIKVLGYDYEGYDRTIDAHIKNLRHKIETKGKKIIKTVYGVGYKFLED